jgi:hypothetical protein
VETQDPNLSLGMRQLNGVYTQRVNIRHHRVGHLFQGRYKAILVKKCVIMVRPHEMRFRAGLAKDPSQYQW